MSELYVPLALGATFGAIVLGGLVVDAWLVGRRRAVESLRRQVPEVGFDFRERQMSEPFLDRVLLPGLARLGDVAQRITPIGMRRRIARQLVLAGSPPNLDADKVAAFKLFGTAGGAVIGFVLGRLFGLTGLLAIAVVPFAALFCYLIPGAGLGQKAINRQEEIQRALPDTMDLLTISVEAGLSFDAALAHVRRKVPGPLSDEIGRMLQEVQLGVPRVDAFRHLADRTSVEELKAFVLAMVQADIFGVSVAKVLRSQAKDLRTRRRQRAEEKAIKVPVKILFPLIFCILPAMFVVLLGPGVITVLRTIFHMKI
jgi:tight adherence protein C